MSNEEQLCHLWELTPSGIEDEGASMGLQDRRRFLRARVGSSAFVVVGRRYGGVYVVRDLSAGGANLAGANNLAIGQVVQILLRVGKRLSQAIEAEVLRLQRLPSGEQSFAVAFRNLAPDMEGSLQNLVVLALERATAKKDAMDAPDRGGSPG
jgi:c-di-GMP-binding flagellar brake protein YcgR